MLAEPRLGCQKPIVKHKDSQSRLSMTNGRLMVALAVHQCNPHVSSDCAYSPMSRLTVLLVWRIFYLTKINRSSPNSFFALSLYLACNARAFRRLLRSSSGISFNTFNSDSESSSSCCAAYS